MCVALDVFSRLLIALVFLAIGPANRHPLIRSAFPGEESCHTKNQTRFHARKSEPTKVAHCSLSSVQ